MLLCPALVQKSSLRATNVCTTVFDIFFQAFKIMLWRLPAYLSTKPSILLIIFYVCMYTVFSIIYKQMHEVQWNYTHEARGIFMEVYSYNQNLQKTASA